MVYIGAVMMSKPIFNTAGLLISYPHTHKINLTANQKGYDNSETATEKLSAKKIRSLGYTFL